MGDLTKAQLIERHDRIEANLLDAKVRAFRERDEFARRATRAEARLRDVNQENERLAHRTRDLEQEAHTLRSHIIAQARALGAVLTDIDAEMAELKRLVRRRTEGADLADHVAGHIQQALTIGDPDSKGP